jgi:N-methylhydantoinase A
MFKELRSRLDGDIEVEHEVALDVRYKGQEHSLTLTLDNNKGVLNLPSKKIRDQFEKEYFEIYGTNLEVLLEVVTVRVALRKSLSKRVLQSNHKQEERKDKSIEAYSFIKEKFVPFKIVERSQLEMGKIIKGPAILTESTTTTYIDVNASFVLDRSGCVFITKKRDNND